jgi:Ca2+-binding EF-hand superfamily protein
LYIAVFNIYDENGGGKISVEHLPAILDKIGRNATEGRDLKSDLKRI